VPALKQTVWMKQGTSRILAFGPVMNSDGVSYTNLAGASAAVWALAQSETATSVMLTKTLGDGLTISSALDNYGATFYLISVTLVPNDTKTLPASIPPVYWVHECQVTDSNGNITFIASGHFHLQPSIINQ
jgi:hypothetical protein